MYGGHLRMVSKMPFGNFVWKFINIGIKYSVSKLSYVYNSGFQKMLCLFSNFGYYIPVCIALCYICTDWRINVYAVFVTQGYIYCTFLAR